MRTPALDSTEFARAEEAALWCVKFSEGRMTREAQQQFAEWLEERPEHRAAFEQAAGAWQEVHAAEASPDFLPLRLEALEGLQQRHRLRAARLARWSWRRRTMAAAAVLLAFAGPIVWWIQHPTTYATGLGERRSVELPDGSAVSLDAATRVTVRYTVHGRELHLLAGRAKFDVAKDPLRPFSVAAGDRVVVATGTEFSVELVNRRVEVVLYEGHVSVLGPAATIAASPALQTHAAKRHVERTASQSLQELAPGHVLDAAIAKPEVAIAAIDGTKSLEWEAGQLEFVDEPLVFAIERMNRYPGPRMSVADDHTGAIKVTGVFTAGETRAFIEGIAAAFPVKVEVDGDTEVFKAKDR
jgi:transmembrane sensor